jgi:hypothetical protein
MKQLRRIRELTDLTLLATDGEIGHVQALYFDDRTWAVRYLVVKAGGWLLSREVLLAPAAVADINDANGTMSIALTKEQIKAAPPIEAAKPLSREYEEAYFRHFQWAPYWADRPRKFTSVSGNATDPDRYDASCRCAQESAPAQHERGHRL